MTDALCIAGLIGLAAAAVALPVAICAAHIPFLARLTGAAPLDKEEQC